MPTVKSLHYYPVKSIASVSVEEAKVGPAGFEGDRRYIVVTESGRMLTGREAPKLVLIRANITDRSSITLSAPDHGSTTISHPEQKHTKPVKVWKDDCSGLDMGEEAASWLSDFIGKPCWLLYVDTRGNRLPSTPQSFVDAAPLLGLSQQSVDDLNTRLEKPVTAGNFRPNILFDIPGQPYGEDTWSVIQIGDVVIDLVWACSRCIFTTVNPATGEKDANMEPYKTLSSYRQQHDKKVYFAQNFVPRNEGIIRVGDKVELLETRDALVTEGDMLKAAGLL